MTKQIFISYSRADLASVYFVYKSLDALHYSIWLDQDGIKGGVDWWKAIENAIDACELVLIFVSPDWLESEICKEEFTYALEKNKEILPILIRKSDLESAGKTHPQLTSLNMFHFYANPRQSYDQILQKFNELNIQPARVQGENFEIRTTLPEDEQVMALGAGDNHILWLVTRFDVDVDIDYFLYRYDTEDRNAEIQKVGQLPDFFEGLHVDPNNNVWVQVENHGTYIYPPDTFDLKDSSEYTNITDQNLTSYLNSVAAFASTKIRDEVFLWIAEKDIQLWSYTGEYPAINDIKLVEYCYKSQKPEQIQTMYFDDRSNTPSLLWALTEQNAIIRINVDTKQADRVPIKDNMLSIFPGQAGTIWVLGSHRFYQYDNDGNYLQKMPEDQEFETLLFDAAVTDDIIWFGAPNGMKLYFSPLSYASYSGHIVDIPLRIQDMHKMYWHAASGILWLVTDEGLISYTK